MTITAADPVTDRRGDAKGEPELVSTYLVVPYFAGDRGRPSLERPLSSAVVWWLCPSIVVNGQPGKNTFRRGEPTTVTVDVANWGAGTASAPVHVQLWWADPSTGFTAKTLLGQAVMVAPTGGGVRRSPPIVGTIPTSAPPHVCLLAYVSSPLDALPQGSPADPVGDRHWAQLNIAEMAAPLGQPFQLIVWAGNPFARAATFAVEARTLSREALETLIRIRRTSALSLEHARLALREGRREEAGEGRDEAIATHRLTLEPGRRRSLHLVGMLPDDVEPGTDVAFEIVQTSADDERVIGATGIVARSASPV